MRLQTGGRTCLRRRAYLLKKAPGRSARPKAGKTFLNYKGKESPRRTAGLEKFKPKSLRAVETKQRTHLGEARILGTVMETETLKGGSQ